MSFRNSDSLSPGQILSSPFRLVWGFLVFMVMSWASSRSGRAFVFAMPAMGVLFGCLATYWVVGQYGYKHAKENSIAARSYHTQFSPDNPEYAEGYAWKSFGLLYDEEKPEENLRHKFELARSLYGNDKKGQAVHLMQLLAPDDEIGYVEAHTWQARYYRYPEVSGLEEKEGHEKSKAHLLRAIEADPEDIVARNELAREYVRGIKWAESTEDEIAMLKDALKYYGQLAFQIEFKGSPIQLEAVTRYLDLLKELGEKDPSNIERYERESRLRAEAAINQYKLFAYRYPNVFQLWLALIRCAVHLEDFDQADELITSSLQLVSEQTTRQQISQLSAQILVEKSDSFSDLSTEEGYRDKLYALCESIATDFRLEESYKRIVTLFDNEDIQDQDIWLRGAITGSGSKKIQIPGVIHILVGLRDIIDENYSEGEKHWELANQQFQFAQYSINNLIKIYSREKEISYEKRLEFMTVVMELFPQQPVYFLTRGEFHKEAEKYDEAISDLEFAKKNFAGVLSLVESLAECYEKVGNTEKQQECEEEAEGIRAKAIAAQRAARNLPPLETEDEDEDDEKEEKEG